MKILVFIQVDDNKINKMSLETLRCAQNLTSNVSAITFHEGAANELSNYNLNEVIFVKNEKLNSYNPLYYTKALETLIDDSCNAILFAHTYETRDWVPRLSARINCPFISDCINLKNENDLLIFDDGLQDKKASYDIQFVCFNEDNWIGNGQLIPSGPLREKLSSLKKYDAVFIKKEKNNKKLNHIHEVIKEINPNIKIFNTEYIVTNLNEFDLSKEYIIFSGIGSPNSFKDILIKKNFKIVNEIIYHDHFNYSEKNLKFIQDKAKDNNADIITTEKDFVKLSKFKYKNIKPLKVEINFLEEKSLINFIKSKLNE